MSIKVTFVEKTHKYYNNFGEEYTSCTTLIKKFTPEFKAEELAQKISKRDNIPIETVLAKWNKAGKDATDFGTKIHKCMEGYVKHNPLLIDTDWKAATKIGYNMLLDEIDDNEIESEKLLFNHEYKIAGQSDIVFTNNHEIYNIADFKTNKKIEFYSKYNEYMLYPLNHLQHCNYNEYALQLSLYAFMLMNMLPTETHIGRMFLLHFNKETNIWTKIPIPYMKHEIMVLLKYWKQVVKK